MAIGYTICLIAAVGLLVTYSVVVKTKKFWLTMLHVCVAVVNLGYLLMSLANTVEFAVFGNDVAYLGSVFLSMCMFLAIVRHCRHEIVVVPGHVFHQALHLRRVGSAVGLRRNISVPQFFKRTSHKLTSL